MNAVAFDGNVYLEDHLTREGRLKRLALRFRKAELAPAR